MNRKPSKAGRDIHPARLLLSANQSQSPALVVENIEIQQKGANFRAYNLSIAKDHTFFVGNSRVWVHNSCDTLYRELKQDESRGRISLGNMSMQEFSGLADDWGMGIFPNLRESFIYHADKHFDRNLAKMLRSAANFSIRGARKYPNYDGNGNDKWIKGGWYIIKNSDSQILTYGRT